MEQNREYYYHLKLGDMYANQGEHQLALDEYNVCQALRPLDISLMTRIGNRHFYLGNFKMAENCHNHYMKYLGWGQQYKFTRDTFTGNIPLWKGIFPQYKDKSFNYLEIGSFEGMSALWVADYCPKANIKCIDLSFQPNFNYNIGVIGNNIQWWEGHSDDIITEFENNSIDVIYIDGSHKAIDVFKDACLSWDLLVPGGIMIFDDYNYYPNMPKLDHHPKFGIDNFLDLFKGEYTLLHKNYQLIIMKNGS